MTNYGCPDLVPTRARRDDGKPSRMTTTSKAAQTVDLDGLTAHLGYLIRRAQIWIFQDFIRTLATEQYVTERVYARRTDQR